METSELSELLLPFFGAEAPAPALLDSLKVYLELLAKWNARINLTAVRDPRDIVKRHFGESLFAARLLTEGRYRAAPESSSKSSERTLLDFGSGAGFPGIPIAIDSPDWNVTLLEARAKKATFLKEVVRACGLKNCAVENLRGEDLDGRFSVVTMRAVERFDDSVAGAVRLLDDGGALALLVGTNQVEGARALLSGFRLDATTAVPESRERVVAVFRRE